MKKTFTSSSNNCFMDKNFLDQVQFCRTYCANIYHKFASSETSSALRDWYSDLASMYAIGTLFPKHWLEKLEWSADPFLLAYARWFNGCKILANSSALMNSLSWGHELTKRASQLLAEVFESSIFLTTKNSMDRLMDFNKFNMVNRVCGFKARHSKLMIVRVDVGFSSIPGGLEVGSVTGHEVFTKGLDRLVSMLRRDYSDCYIHHEAKLEYAIDRGLHAHLLILFNGSIVREDETIGLMIAKYWRSLFPAGVGWAYNDNNPARKSQLQPFGLALGVFCNDDPIFVANVSKAVRYMAKPDYLLRVAFPGIKRSMRSAHIDRIKWDRKMNSPLVRQRLHKMGLD